MNDQRKIIFEQRREIMESEDVSDITKEMRYEVVQNLVLTFIPENSYKEQWNLVDLQKQIKEEINLEIPLLDFAENEDIGQNEILDKITEEADKAIAKKMSDFGF